MAPRECMVCFGDDDEDTPLLQLPCSTHYVCPGECLARTFQEAMKDEKIFPAQCCEAIILIDDYIDLIPFELYWEYKKKESGEFSMQARSRRYCANTSCARFLHSEGYEDDTEIVLAKCNYCPAITCVTCKTLLLMSSDLKNCNGIALTTLSDGTALEDPCQNEKGRRCKSCSDIFHAALLQHICEIPEEDKKFKIAAKEKGYQECFGCGSTVELAEACNHMTCECGNEFCYVCGKPWQGLHECPLYGQPQYDEEGYNQDGFHKETGLNRDGLTREQERRQRNGEDEESDSEDEDDVDDNDLPGIDPEFRQILANMDPEERLEALEQARFFAAERGEIVLGEDEEHGDGEGEDDHDSAGEDIVEADEDGEGQGEHSENEGEVTAEQTQPLVQDDGEDVSEEEGPLPNFATTNDDYARLSVTPEGVPEITFTWPNNDDLYAPPSPTGVADGFSNASNTATPSPPEQRQSFGFEASSSPLAPTPQVAYLDGTNFILATPNEPVQSHTTPGAWVEDN